MLLQWTGQMPASWHLSEPADMAKPAKAKDREMEGLTFVRSGIRYKLLRSYSRQDKYADMHRLCAPCRKLGTKDVFLLRRPNGLARRVPCFLVRYPMQEGGGTLGDLTVPRR